MERKPPGGLFQGRDSEIHQGYQLRAGKNADLESPEVSLEAPSAF
jgi:hypothetical protein